MRNQPGTAIAVMLLVAVIGAGCGAGSTSPSPSGKTAPSSLPGTPSMSPPSTAAPVSAAPSPSSAGPLAWRPVTVDGPKPDGREDHTWTADPATGALWLFGGRAGATVFDDLWRFDPGTSSWSAVVPAGPAPAGRFGHTGTWVPGRGLVVWSGQAGSTFFADLWAYDPIANRWTELPAGGAPPPARYGSCAALGPDGRLWISHGFTQDAGRFSDTVAYDFAAGAWVDETGEGPVIRCLHDCLFTPDGELVLYAGQTTGAPAIGDLWVRPVDGRWSPAPDGEPAPAPRQLYGLATAGASAYIFGGGAADRTKLRDLWRLDLGSLTWEALQPAGEPPSARSGSAMQQDTTMDRILLFGGTDGANALDDLWELTPVG